MSARIPWLGHAVCAAVVCGSVVSVATAAPYKSVYATGLIEPEEIAFGPDGTLFCGRSGGSGLSVFRVPPGGGVAAEWGDPVLADPDGIDVDSEGNVYSTNGQWANQLNGEVIMLDSEGKAGAIGSNYLRNCMSVELDRSGRFGGPGSILVGVQSSDIGGSNGSEIVLVDPHAAGGPYVESIYSTNRSIYCWSLSFDHEDALWFMHGIGLMKWLPGEPAPQDFALTGVSGSLGPLAFDPTTNTMIVGLREDRKVVRVSTDGQYLELLADDLHPSALTVAPDGVIYVSDGAASVIWMVPEPVTLLLLAVGGLAVLRRGTGREKRARSD